MTALISSSVRPLLPPATSDLGEVQVFRDHDTVGIMMSDAVPVRLSQTVALSQCPSRTRSLEPESPDQASDSDCDSAVPAGGKDIAAGPTAMRNVWIAFMLLVIGGPIGLHLLYLGYFFSKDHFSCLVRTSSLYSFVQADISRRFCGL